MIKLNVGVKYKNVNWTMRQTLYLIKNYNILAQKSFRIDKTTRSIGSKTTKMHLTLIRRKSRANQVKINNKVCEHIIYLCEYYNKNHELDMKFFKSMKPNIRKVVENSFPKAYFNVMKKNTAVIAFVREYKRMPSGKARNVTERRLGSYINIVQYNKYNPSFLLQLETVKHVNGIVSRIGDKKIASEERFMKLINFVKEHKRIPSHSRNSDSEELSLARFFNATAARSGFNSKIEWYLANLDEFLPYMDSKLYNRTKYFWGVMN